MYIVDLGGVMVSVLAIGSKVRGFKPGRVRWILREIKIRSTTFFGWEVKHSVTYRKILQHAKDPAGMNRDISL
jgi:hypothetical protein